MYQTSLYNLFIEKCDEKSSSTGIISNVKSKKVCSVWEELIKTAVYHPVMQTFSWQWLGYDDSLACVLVENVPKHEGKNKMYGSEKRKWINSIYLSDISLFSMIISASRWSQLNILPAQLTFLWVGYGRYPWDAYNILVWGPPWSTLDWDIRNPQTSMPHETTAILSFSVLYNVQWTFPSSMLIRRLTRLHTHRIHWAATPAFHIHMLISQRWGCAKSDSVE